MLLFTTLTALLLPAVTPTLLLNTAIPSVISQASTQDATTDDYEDIIRLLSGKKGNEQLVIKLSDKVLTINPQDASAYYNRGVAKSDLGDKQGAIADYSQAIAINPQDANAYHNRGFAKSDLADKQGAIADFNQSIAINPQNANAYTNRGAAKFDLGDKQGSCLDYKKAVTLGHTSTFQWLQSKDGIWCRNMP